jgi:hypothetical protein
MGGRSESGTAGGCECLACKRSWDNVDGSIGQRSGCCRRAGPRVGFGGQPWPARLTCLRQFRRTGHFGRIIHVMLTTEIESIWRCHTGRIHRPFRLNRPLCTFGSPARPTPPGCRDPSIGVRTEYRMPPPQQPSACVYSTNCAGADCRKWPPSKPRPDRITPRSFATQPAARDCRSGPSRGTAPTSTSAKETAVGGSSMR